MPGEVAAPARAGTSAGGLLSRGLQRAALARAVDLAEQEDPLHPLVRGHGGHLAGSGG